jgi:hypothetical protein
MFPPQSSLFEPSWILTQISMVGTDQHRTWHKYRYSI